MQILKNWLPIIAAIVGIFLIGNGGFTLSDALNMDTSNLSVLIQGIVSLLGGLGFGGAGWYYKGTKVDTGTFDSDVDAVKHLASTCKGCKKSSEALQVIHSQILEKELEPDAE